MKKTIVLFYCCSFIFSCVNKQEDINTSIKKEVNKMLNNWHIAASDAKFDNYFSLMDENSIFIGTDASENWTKKEFSDFSKPYFDKGKAWSFKPLERNIYVYNNGKLIWFDELLKTWMGTCRGSGIVEKVNNKWKIKHYVLSVSIPNEDINNVIKLKRKSDSIFLKSNYE